MLAVLYFMNVKNIKSNGINVKIIIEKYPDFFLNKIATIVFKKGGTFVFCSNICHYQIILFRDVTFCR